MSEQTHHEALLLEALKPFAALKLPTIKSPGNAGFYSLRFDDIRRAKAALSNSERTDG